MSNYVPLRSFTWGHVEVMVVTGINSMQKNVSAKKMSFPHGQQVIDEKSDNML